MKQVLLIRHCETSLQGRYIGRTDPSLTASGIVRARGLAGRLQRLVRAPTSRQIPVLSSPARRAVETARLATEWTGSGIWRDEDLREIDFGGWEGKDFREIVATDAELVDKWARDEMGFCFSGGGMRRRLSGTGEARGAPAPGPSGRDGCGRDPRRRDSISDLSFPGTTATITLSVRSCPRLHHRISFVRWRRGPYGIE
uniref:Histidine phosphatase superfamily (Branch 1) n=1 Tax=Candidatus Kentrum sp. SD TaxID=2126332 RepID=A0A450YNF5_9GAMM|nr:MAG: Histidine phosphatase superfamily (branch 1) [Candidatus Kentron sp. SD]VFK43081.1 MAG: Histidine phosphatase superfamily (branch 1) [Candidatus Kentron sp. SD]VFK77731.1 MAG: Histidine phosphatase superfamily (branch 1) [Candidatus Kentron sp. SD]